MEDGPQLTVQMEAPQAGAASQQPGQPLVSAVPAQAELLQQGVGLPVRTPGSGIIIIISISIIIIIIIIMSIIIIVSISPTSAPRPPRCPPPRCCRSPRLL